MTPDSIERETTIEAPVERVWELLTQAAARRPAGSATPAPRSTCARAAR